MPDRQRNLRDDALAIWRAGVEAVNSSALVRDAVQVDQQTLQIAGHAFDLARIQRIAVVGGGKAGAGMAQGLVSALGDKIATEKKLAGWLNVPAGCVTDLPYIQLHAGRPDG